MLLSLSAHALRVRIEAVDLRGHSKKDCADSGVLPSCVRRHLVASSDIMQMNFGQLHKEEKTTQTLCSKAREELEKVHDYNCSQKQIL